MKIYITVDFIKANARYGHLEGEVDFSEEEEKDFRTLLNKEWDGEKLTDEEIERLDNYKIDIEDNCELVVDDWDLEEWGDCEWDDLL